jgi:hypothetical protein
LLVSAAWAVYVFAVPHAPGFAPEIGKEGAFLAFWAIGSAIYYFLAMLLGFVVLVATTEPSRDA